MARVLIVEGRIIWVEKILDAVSNRWKGRSFFTKKEEI